MAITITRKCQRLSDNEGSFVAEDGRQVDFHNALFADIETEQIFKANIAKGASIPPAFKPAVMSFDLHLFQSGNHKLEYVGCE